MTNSTLIYLLGPQSTWISTAEGVGFRGKLQTALLIALSSSHGYLLVRMMVHHGLYRLLWKGTDEERHAREADREVKRAYLQSLVGNSERDDSQGDVVNASSSNSGFWSRDEGMDEYQS